MPNRQEMSNLLRWAEAQGAVSAAEPAFQNGIWGLAAKQDLEAGDTVMTIPESMLIHEGTISSTDLGQALGALGLHSGDILLIIWTMVDRHQSDSVQARFWQSLPEQFATGLGVPDIVSGCLEGTPAFDKVQHARQHIQENYTAMRPVLTALITAYPEHIKAEYVAWPAYIWAVQLWYAYALEVILKPGELRQCLIPLVSLFNHDSQGHIRQYGRLDTRSGRMEFPTSRQCRKGEQLLLSYGKLPNWRLLLFYGFAVQENEYDTLSITVGQGDQSQGSIPSHDIQSERGRRVLELRFEEAPDWLLLESLAMSPSSTSCAVNNIANECMGFSLLSKLLEVQVSQLYSAQRSLLQCAEKAHHDSFIQYSAIYVEEQLRICRWHQEHCRTLAIQYHQQHPPPA